jgi:hypothetical protein
VGSRKQHGAPADRRCGQDASWSVGPRAPGSPHSQPPPLQGPTPVMRQIRRNHWIGTMPAHNGFPVASARRKLVMSAIRILLQVILRMAHVLTCSCCRLDIASDKPCSVVLRKRRIASCSREVQQHAMASGCGVVSGSSCIVQQQCLHVARPWSYSGSARYCKRSNQTHTPVACI